MGIDPGLNKTGVGIIGWDKGKLSYQGHALVRSDVRAPFTERLSQIISGLQAQLSRFSYHSAAVEDVFHSVNARSALLLGQTRGAILATLLNYGVPICEYTALQIKQTVTGYGRAEKEQVAKMVALQLNIVIKKQLPLDVTDALAGGICLAINQTGKVR
ncbi:crossover junction endodeoxyribonuclease RuvC [Deferribacterales bacterium RsTz2092]